MIKSEVIKRFHRIRLVVYGVLAVSYMLVFFHRVAPGAVAADLMRDFDMTGAALGSLAAMYFYIYSVMQIPAGVLADTLGVRIAATVGALVAGVGSILFALASNFGAASMGRFLVGLGVSVVFVGLMRSNTEWWSERRYGFISGLTVSLGNVGAILAAAPLALALTVASWRTVFVFIGLLSIVIAVLTFLFVRDRPENMGLPSLREMEGKPSHEPRSQHWLRDLSKVLRTRAIWPGFWANFGMTGSMLALVGLWGVPMLTDVHGLSRASASFYTSVTIAALAAGSLILGSFSDRIHRRKPVLVFACFAVCLTWWAFLFLPWHPGWSGLLLFAFLGFSGGGFVVTFGAAKEIVPPNVAGMAIAVVNTGTFLGTAIMQPLFGALLDLTWDGTMVGGVRMYHAIDYSNGLMMFLGIAMFAAIASLYLRETNCRNITVADSGRAGR